MDGLKSASEQSRLEAAQAASRREASNESDAHALTRVGGGGAAAVVDGSWDILSHIGFMQSANVLPTWCVVGAGGRVGGRGLGPIVHRDVISTTHIISSSRLPPDLTPKPIVKPASAVKARPPRVVVIGE